MLVALLLPRCRVANRKGASGDREMMQAIDLLANAMPDGQLMAAMGPLAFLGAAAGCIKTLREELLGAAEDLTDDFACKCEDDSGDCECGGDGTGGLDGCWACFATRLRQVANGVDWPRRALAAAAVPRKEPTP